MSLDRRDFLTLGVATLAVTLESCVAKFAPVRHKITPNVQVSDSRLLPRKFQDYDLTNPTQRYTLEDHLLYQFISDNIGMHGLRGRPKGIDTSPTVGTVKDLQKFGNVVLEVADILGYSPERISDLSIKEAVLLSGKIVAKKLSFNDESVDRMYKNQQDVISGKISIVDAVKANIKEDSRSPDEIFVEGRGVCRHYSKVNIKVFDVLKMLNPHLVNTYMMDFTPVENDPVPYKNSFGITDDLNYGSDHKNQLPHAWNMVSTIESDGTKVTFVDPTWLDSKIFDATNSGKKKQISDEQAYNAWDKSHFSRREVLDIFSWLKIETNSKNFMSPEYHFAHQFFAQVYEALANPLRIANKDSNLKISAEKCRQYQTYGYSFRSNLCRQWLMRPKSEKGKRISKKHVFNGSYLAIETSYKLMLEDALGHKVEQIGPSSKLSAKDFAKMVFFYKSATSYIPEAKRIKETFKIASEVFNRI